MYIPVIMINFGRLVWPNILKEKALTTSYFYSVVSQLLTLTTKNIFSTHFLVEMKIVKSNLKFIFWFLLSNNQNCRNLGTLHWTHMCISYVPLACSCHSTPKYFILVVTRTCKDEVLNKKNFANVYMQCNLMWWLAKKEV